MENDAAALANKKKHQNSAAVLSLWHCIFSWFYMNCEKKHSYDKDAKETLCTVYYRMDVLRHIIKPSEDVNPNVDSIVTHFQKLVKKIDQKSWNSVIKSMMHEIMEMLRVLKGNKDEFLHNIEKDADDVKITKVKQLTCLLTLWYWLAAWSVDNNSSDELKRAKARYFECIEIHGAELNNVLFSDSTEINEEVRKSYQIMVTKLAKLIKADLQHWIYVLDHFINRMVHAGSLRAQVRNVWADAQAKHEVALVFSSTGVTPSVDEPKPAAPSPTEPLLVHGLGLLLKNVATRTPLSAIADKIPDAVSFVYNDVKKGDLKDIVNHIPNVVGEVAGPEAKHIAQAVAQGAEFVGEHVVDGVKEAAHILGEGVHGFANGVHTVFHSVKNFFSHIF